MSTAIGTLMSLSVFLQSPVKAWTSGASRGEGAIELWLAGLSEYSKVLWGQTDHRGGE